MVLYGIESAMTKGIKMVIAGIAVQWVDALFLFAVQHKLRFAWHAVASAVAFLYIILNFEWSHLPAVMHIGKSFFHLFVGVHVHGFVILATPLCHAWAMDQTCQRTDLMAWWWPTSVCAVLGKISMLVQDVPFLLMCILSLVASLKGMPEEGFFVLNFFV